MTSHASRRDPDKRTELESFQTADCRQYSGQPTSPRLRVRYTAFNSMGAINPEDSISSTLADCHSTIKPCAQDPKTPPDSLPELNQKNTPIRSTSMYQSSVGTDSCYPAVLKSHDAAPCKPSGEVLRVCRILERFKKCSHFNTLPTRRALGLP